MSTLDFNYVGCDEFEIGRHPVAITWWRRRALKELVTREYLFVM
jgi:hypothetical protein